MHSYPVVIGKNTLQDRDLLRSHATLHQVLIVTSQTIAALYLQNLKAVFSDRQCDVVILPDGEPYKNRDSLFQIYDALIKNGHHRDTTLIALGGGVIGDLCGFAASTYQRGVNFLQIPTTLLAQVDASVGGKTAINYGQAKNVIGSFYQPRAVIIDLNTLDTLPLREFRAGLAEVIKYAVLQGGDFFTRIFNELQSGLADKNATDLGDIILQCCEIKATIVAQDERETGCRALLNLGHTLAHALESYTEYGRWLHGEAVAIGLYAAALLSHKYFGLSLTYLEQIDTMLAMAGLPRRLPADINLEALRTEMEKDKKIKNNTLRFILVREPGDCYIQDHISESSIRTVLQQAV